MKISEVKCGLCAKGFPLIGENHVGCQRLGMIPTTRCRKLPKLKSPTRQELIDLLGNAPDIWTDETPIQFMARFEVWLKRAKEILERLG